VDARQIAHALEMLFADLPRWQEAALANAESIRRRWSWHEPIAKWLELDRVAAPLPPLPQEPQTKPWGTL
jgi:hypothetical protein